MWMNDGALGPFHDVVFFVVKNYSLVRPKQHVLIILLEYCFAHQFAILVVDQASQLDFWELVELGFYVAYFTANWS